jgi:hypothetical protein
MQPRRAQQPISFRSDKAAARLAVLTRGGRSQAEVIEDALERVPEPVTPRDVVVARIARIDAILAEVDPADVMSMAEFDALTYDENGLPR